VSLTNGPDVAVLSVTAKYNVDTGWDTLIYKICNSINADDYVDFITCSKNVDEKVAAIADLWGTDLMHDSTGEYNAFAENERSIFRS
jgi:hypothetical protein